VNLQAGARTGLSNVFSSGVVMIVLLFLSPLLYYLPQAVLAAIIMMAVFGLLNVSGFVHAWRTSPFDGMVSVITFVGTLALAPHLEWGIFMGVVLSLAGYLYRSMRPHVARLAPAADGAVRDAVRHDLGSCRHVAVIGFDGPLNFASTSYLEDEILRQVSEHPDLRYLLVSGSGITEIDASGEETLRNLVDRLRSSRIEVGLTGLSDKVVDVLRRSHLYDRIGEEHFFATVARAIAAVYAPAHRNTDEPDCPFLGVVPKLTELSLHPDGSLRDADRHRLALCRHIIALRIDSPLNRASVRYVQEWVMERTSGRAELRHVLLVAHGMTEIDTEAAHRLADLVGALREHGLGVSFSGLQDGVLDVLEHTGDVDAIGRSNLYPSQIAAVASIWPEAHLDSDETVCPLRPLAPHLTELAPHTDGTLRDASRHGLPLCDTVAVLRFDGALLFANSSALITEFERWLSDRPRVRVVILAGTTLSHMDAVRARHLWEFVQHVRERSIQVALCHVSEQVADVLAETGVAADIGANSIFPSVSQALQAIFTEDRDLADDDCPLLKMIADR
jgi:MFS superfamily sulfate permease-like transporter